MKRFFLVLSPVFFSSGYGVKRLFNKAFDLDCWLLASDCFKEEMNPSFASCQCSKVIKANKIWQQELLNSKIVCMVEPILLAATIFCDPNFALCPKHILNLARKLGTKTKKLKIMVINKQIGQICANKPIAELDLLFKNNFEW